MYVAEFFLTSFYPMYLFLPCLKNKFIYGNLLNWGFGYIGIRSIWGGGGVSGWGLQCLLEPFYNIYHKLKGGGGYLYQLPRSAAIMCLSNLKI